MTKATFVTVLAGMVGCTFVQQVSAGDAGRVREIALHSFSCCTDGQAPYGGLIDVDGTLYGTTNFGGANCEEEEQGCGTVFALDRKKGAETVLYSFCNLQNCRDGQYPYAGLIAVNGELYGTTYQVNISGGGTVFVLDPKTGAEKVLHTFGIGTDGQYPYGGLIDVKGTLYGTTIQGGANGYGTVFALDPKARAETIAYSFGNSGDGQQPYSTLIEGNGTLYGTTLMGGAFGSGTVFVIDLNSGAETVVHSFCSQANCADGKEPTAGLIDVKGTLYGTTELGGAAGGGTIFSLDPVTGVQTVLHSFCSQQSCADGQNPAASLIDVKGTLYGTTANGGAHGDGTIFSPNLASGAEKLVYSFCSQQGCTDGWSPYANLIDVKGNLYGAAAAGGTAGLGTVFVVKR
jgi:uncharacterized repeat protein (TIGR03803 family)